jgi:hypothetical protein
MSTNYGKLTGGIIAAWFTFSFVAGALQVFKGTPGRPPLPILASVLIPVIAYAIWYATSTGFRQFVLGLNPSTVTMLHFWRIMGFVFLVLYTYNILPGIFALPAGWGDIAIGATAPIVASKLANPKNRGSFIFWQILGILDLLVAIVMGALTRFISPSAIQTDAMAVLPMSLIPTFAVPLLLILHFISIAQARQWARQGNPRVSQQLPLATV